MTSEIRWHATRLGLNATIVLVASSAVAGLGLLTTLSGQGRWGSPWEPGNFIGIIVAFVGVPLVFLPPALSRWPTSVGISSESVTLRWVVRELTVPKTIILGVKVRSGLFGEIILETSGRRFWIPTRNVQLMRELKAMGGPLREA